MKGAGSMDNSQIAYNGEFTIEERKAMTAQVLQELRKGRKLSQKEVAAHLNIPATTYNTYESGRTEPPIEILVRLSHLYGVPTDLIVQRDRTYRTADDVGRQLAEYKAQLAELDKQLAENGTDVPGVTDFLASLNKLADAMTAYSQTEAAQKALNKPTQN
jgi:transcriptional regulator with XRE-family HTH domain